VTSGVLAYRYPLYRRGNPQLRVFLPNFWMKLVQLEHSSRPANKVDFIVSQGMTQKDVKNYLERIYKVEVAHVKTINCSGRTHYHKKLQDIIKDDDFKLAFVTLARGQTFEYPDVVKLDQLDVKAKKAEDDVEETKKAFRKNLGQGGQATRTGLPSFFGL